MGSELVPASTRSQTSDCEQCSAHERRDFTLAHLQELGKGNCHRCYVIAQGLQALVERYGFPTDDSWDIDIGDHNTWDPGTYSVFWAKQGGDMRWDATFYTDLDDKSSPDAWPTKRWHHRVWGTSPTTSLQFAFQALDECLKAHSCHLQEEVLLPKRLLHVQSTSVGEDLLRVVPSAQFSDPETVRTVRYVALKLLLGRR